MRTGWLGPYVVRNDGLTADGSKGLPGMEVCGKTINTTDGKPWIPGCLGDYPVVGVDEYGLW